MIASPHMGTPRVTGRLQKLKRGGVEYWQAVVRYGADSRRKTATKSLGPVKTHKPSIDNRRRKTPITRTEAQIALGEFMDEVRNNPPDIEATGAVPTLEQWGERYLKLRKNEVGANTYLNHEKTIGYLKERFGKSQKIDAITLSEMDDWRSWLLGEKGLTETTACGHSKRAKIFFQRAVDRGSIRANPARNLRTNAPKPDKRVPELSEADLDRLVGSIEDDRYRRLMAICAYAGLRRSEALALTWADLDPDRGRLVVVNACGRETTKGRTREVRLEPRLLAALGEMEGDADEDVCGFFGHTPSHHTVIRIIRKAGFKPWPRPLHALRAVRSMLWKERFPAYVVDQWIGHSPAVAAQYYNRTVAERFYEGGANQVERAESVLMELSVEEREQILNRVMDARKTEEQS